MSHEKIYECLVYDPISPEVRFQEGIYLEQEGKFDEACISFLISALVAEWNVAAWLNSFFMALETKSHLMGIVLYVAYKKCGYSLIEVLREEVLKNKKIPLELKTQVIDVMREQFETYKNKEIDNKANSADAKSGAAD